MFDRVLNTPLCSESKTYHFWSYMLKSEKLFHIKAKCQFKKSQQQWRNISQNKTCFSFIKLYYNFVWKVLFKVKDIPFPRQWCRSSVSLLLTLNNDFKQVVAGWIIEIMRQKLKPLLCTTTALHLQHYWQPITDKFSLTFWSVIFAKPEWIARFTDICS